MPRPVLPDRMRHPYAPSDEAPEPVRTGFELLGSRTASFAYGDPDAAVTIVAVHGFRGEHHGLEPIVERLPEYRILSPDLPGFGESTPMTDAAHDIGGYGRWLTSYLDAAGVRGSAVLLGHSFGSIVAAHAVAGGLPTPRLVLVNPIGAPALSGPRGVFTRLAVGYYRLGAGLPERAGLALLRDRRIVRIVSGAMVKTRDPALQRWIHDEHGRFFSRFADRRVVLEAFRASVSHDVREVAERIRVPTLLVAAELDDITPIEAERALQRAMPDARLVEIGRVGHLIHYETPGPAADAVRAFLPVDGLGDRA